MITLIVQNPRLVQQTFNVIIPYYLRKYNIFSIIFNNKTILYYGI